MYRFCDIRLHEGDVTWENSFYRLLYIGLCRCSHQSQVVHVQVWVEILCTRLVLQLSLSGRLLRIHAFWNTMNQYNLIPETSGLPIAVNHICPAPVWALRSAFCCACSFLEQALCENALYFWIKSFIAKSNDDSLFGFGRGFQIFLIWVSRGSVWRC